MRQMIQISFESEAHPLKRLLFKQFIQQKNRFVIKPKPKTFPAPIKCKTYMTEIISSIQQQSAVGLLDSLDGGEVFPKFRDRDPFDVDLHLGDIAGEVSGEQTVAQHLDLALLGELPDREQLGAGIDGEVLLQHEGVTVALLHRHLQRELDAVEVGTHQLDLLHVVRVVVQIVHPPQQLPVHLPPLRVGSFVDLHVAVQALEGYVQAPGTLLCVLQKQRLNFEHQFLTLVKNQHQWLGDNLGGAAPQLLAVLVGEDSYKGLQTPLTYGLIDTFEQGGGVSNIVLQKEYQAYFFRELFCVLQNSAKNVKTPASPFRKSRKVYWVVGSLLPMQDSVAIEVDHLEEIPEAHHLAVIPDDCLDFQEGERLEIDQQNMARIGIWHRLHHPEVPVDIQAEVIVVHEEVKGSGLAAHHSGGFIRLVSLLHSLIRTRLLASLFDFCDGLHEIVYFNYKTLIQCRIN